MKTHYASIKTDYYTLCGLAHTKSPLTDDIGYVTCVRCNTKIDDNLNNTYNRMKKDPLFNENVEFGKLLMKHITDLTPSEKQRYDELREIIENYQ